MEYDFSCIVSVHTHRLMGGANHGTCCYYYYYFDYCISVSFVFVRSFASTFSVFLAVCCQNSQNNRIVWWCECLYHISYEVTIEHETKDYCVTAYSRYQANRLFMMMIFAHLIKIDWQLSLPVIVYKIQSKATTPRYVLLLEFKWLDCVKKNDKKLVFISWGCNVKYQL